MQTPNGRTPKQPIYYRRALSNAGINVCASQKEKTSLGPVMSSYVCRQLRAKGLWVTLAFGVNPLKKLVKPSFFIMLPTMRKPLSGFSKLRFWILVLITSRGADTIRDALAPAMDATKFCSQLAVL